MTAEADPPVDEDSDEAPPAPVRGPAKRALIPRREYEARLRQIELMMLRSASMSVIREFARKKWGMSSMTVGSYVRRVELQWRREWLDDPDRVKARDRAKRSLESTIEECHSIISSRRERIEPGPGGKMVKRTFYVYPTAQRLRAMTTLAGLERELSKISGYASPDTLIDARGAVLVQQPTPLEGEPKPLVLPTQARSLTTRVSIEDRLLRSVQDESAVIDAEKVDDGR